MNKPTSSSLADAMRSGLDGRPTGRLDALDTIEDLEDAEFDERTD